MAQNFGIVDRLNKYKCGAMFKSAKIFPGKIETIDILYIDS